MDQFELFLSKSRSLKIDARDEKVDSLTQSEDLGLSIRILKDSRLGFSFTTSISEDSVKSAVASALQVLEIMPADPFAAIGRFSKTIPSLAGRYDEPGLAVPVREKIARAIELERVCRESDARIKAVRSASFSESSYESHLLNSDEVHLSHRGTYFSASISCKAEEKGDAQMGGEYDFSTDFAKVDFRKVAQLAAVNATELLGGTVPKTRVCPGIIRNDVVSELIDFLASSFSGEEIDQGKSMLADKLGKTVFSPKVTLMDDGLLPGGYSSRPFDAEGTASQTTTVVGGGVFENMILDQRYGRKLKQPSTGNSSRSIKAPPSIGLTNFYLKAGNPSLTELVRQAHHGVLITHLMGVHTANPVTGAFSLGASGLLIENGKLTRPIKGFAVAGNVLDLFRNLTEIGSDLRFFGNIGAPSILIPEIAISGE